MTDAPNNPIAAEPIQKIGEIVVCQTCKQRAVFQYDIYRDNHVGQCGHRMTNEQYRNAER